MELENAQAMIVDDDPELRALVRRVLEGAGMRVTEAIGVEEALQAAALQAPHVIISDLNMPGQSGYALIERCRKIARLRSAPILVLSAQNDTASVYRAISLGASDYLLKPFRPSGLIQKLKRALKGKEKQRHEFRPGERPAIQLALDALIVEAGESGLRIEAPLRLAPETSIHVDSPLLATMGLDGLAIRTSPRQPILRRQGQYLNDAIPVGLSEAGLQKVRRFLKGGA